MPPIDNPKANPTKPDAPPEKRVEQPAKAADAAVETLSQQATKPGDKGALAAVRPPADEIPKDFGAAPKIVSADTPAHLSETELQQRSKDLHTAVDQRSWGMSSPDAEGVKRILEAVKDPADLKKLQEIYQTQARTDGKKVALNDDLKSHLGDYDFRKSEALLNSTGDRTNDAGNLMAAITLSKSDFARGNAEIRTTMSTLSAADIAKLDTDFTKAYGHGYKQELENSANLSPQTKKALETLAKGSDVWQHDKAAIKDLATLAVNNGDQRMFTEAMGVNTPEAELARRELTSSPELRDKLIQKFPSTEYNNTVSEAPEVATFMDWKKKIDPAVVDYLTEGHPSLKTIVEQNTNKGLFTNKENVELAVRNSTPSERALFSTGQDKINGSAEAQEYYDKVHKAFVAGGTPREVAVWEDQLRNGKPSIIGDMAKTHTDGLFGGHNQNELLTKAESLNQKDWQKLRPPNDSTFRTQIDDSLKTYATDKERERIMTMIDAKAGKDTYEEATKIRRDFDTVVKDTQNSGLASALGLRTGGDTKAVLQRLSQLTPEEAAKYKDDPNFKAGVDKYINDLSNPTEKLFGQNLLKQVGDTGKPVELNPVDKLLQASVEQRPTTETLALAETALQDKALRDRLAKPDGELSPADRTLKQAVSSTIELELQKKLGMSSSPEAVASFTERYMKDLLNNGQLSSSDKNDLGFSKKDMIAAMTTEPEADRQKGMTRLTEQEHQVVKAALTNADSKPDLADRVRTFAIGSDSDHQQFQKELQSMSFADKQKLREEYVSKYSVDLDKDFVGKIPQRDQSEYQSLLASAPSDGRQTFYDRFHQLLQSDSGSTPDGTQTTVERANTQMQNALSEYQRISQTLPPEKQQALDKYFSQALDQQKESKQKYAEIATDAVITAAALVGAPWTGGVSMAAVASIAASAGAVARPAMLAAMEGKDFDGSVDYLLRQGGIGAFTASLNFIGAEAFAGAGKQAVTAGAKLADGAAGDAALATGEQQALRSGVTKLTAKYGDASTPMTQAQTAAFQQDLAKTIEQATPHAPQSVRDELAKSVANNFEKTVAQEQKVISDDLAQRTIAQIARDRAANIVQNGVVGGVGGAASEIVVPTLAGGQVDWNSVGRGALAGFGAGALIGAVIHAPGMAKDYHVNLRRGQAGEGTTPGQTDAPISVRSNDQKEPVTVRQADGKLVQLKPGDNQEYVLKTGDEIVAAATVAAAAKIKAPANDNHAPIPEDVRQPIRVGERPGINAYGPVIKTETPVASAGNNVRPPSAIMGPAGPRAPSPSLEPIVAPAPPSRFSGTLSLKPGAGRVAAIGSTEREALKPSIPTTGDRPSNVLAFEKPVDVTPKETADQVKATLRELNAAPNKPADKKVLDQLIAVASPESLTRLQQQGAITAEQAKTLQDFAGSKLSRYETKPADVNRITDVAKITEQIKWLQDNAGIKNTKAYADLVMTDLNRPDLKIPLERLRQADSKTLDFYNGRIQEAASIRPANPKSPGGDRYEYAAQQAILQNMEGNPSFKDWVFVPGAKGSASDHSGIDGIMLNLNDHRVIPVDIKSSPEVTATAQREGNKWAIDLGAVEKPRFKDADGYEKEGLFSIPPSPADMTTAIRVMLTKPAINGNAFTEFGGSVPFPPLRTNGDLKSTLSNFSDSAAKTTDPVLRYFGDRAEGALPYADAQKFAVKDFTKRLGNEMKIADSDPRTPQFTKEKDATGSFLNIHIAKGSPLGSKYGTATDLRVYEDGTVKMVTVKNRNEPISIGKVSELMRAANPSFKSSTFGDDLTGIDLMRQGKLTATETQNLFQNHPEYKDLGNAASRPAAGQAARSSDQAVEADLPRLQAIDPGLDDSAVRAIAVDRQKFADKQMNLSDEDMVQMYNDTKGMSTVSRRDKVDKVAAEMAEYRKAWGPDFTYGDWKNAEAARVEFTKFGLPSPSTEELALLSKSNPEEVAVRRNEVFNAELGKFVHSITKPNEQVPAWLQSIVDGKPGAIEAVRHDSAERSQFRAILMFYYAGRNNPEYAADLVLDTL